MIRAIVVVLVATLACGPTSQPGSDPRAAARAEVERTAREFLTAFENLDWKRFTASFENDATVFFPAPEPPNRFTGRSQFEPQFQKVFAAIRASNPSGPPYHQLVPEALEVDVLARDVALVSFLLRNDQRIARRTLVLVRIEGRWLIHHLHASNVQRE